MSFQNVKANRERSSLSLWNLYCKQYCLLGIKQLTPSACRACPLGGGASPHSHKKLQYVVYRPPLCPAARNFQPPASGGMGRLLSSTGREQHELQLDELVGHPRNSPDWPDGVTSAGNSRVFKVLSATRQFFPELRQIFPSPNKFSRGQTMLTRGQTMFTQGQTKLTRGQTFPTGSPAFPIGSPQFSTAARLFLTWPCLFPSGGQIFLTWDHAPSSGGCTLPSGAWTMISATGAEFTAAPTTPYKRGSGKRGRGLRRSQGQMAGFRTSFPPQPRYAILSICRTDNQRMGDTWHPENICEICTGR